mmetsp:Transcript_35324/g.94660  ORF Transcript_35324/g.94660 Transcript_35324/m.94660 type:complete len:172 (-) Transcript_35324:525-1040(-)
MRRGEGRLPQEGLGLCTGWDRSVHKRIRPVHCRSGECRAVSSAVAFLILTPHVRPQVGDEGCNLFGDMDLTTVNGNFHFAPGKKMGEVKVPPGHQPCHHHPPPHAHARTPTPPPTPRSTALYSRAHGLLGKQARPLHSVRARELHIPVVQHKPRDKVALVRQHFPGHHQPA